MRLPLVAKVVFMHSIRLVSLFSVIGALNLFAPSALATETRVSTLQGIGGIQDEVDVFTYSSTLSRYNLALVELGTAGNTEVYGGAMAKVGGIHAGVFVSRSSWIFTESVMGTNVSLFDRFEAAATGSEANNPALLNEPGRPFELLAAMPAGNGTLGLRLAYAAINQTTKSEVLGVSSKSTKSADQIQLGVGYSMGNFDMELTVDPTIKQSNSKTAGGATTSTTVKGKTSVELAGRWLESIESSGLYGNGTFKTRTLELKSSSAGANESSKFEDREITLEGGYAALTRNKTANLYTGAVLANVLSKGPTVTGVGEKTVGSHLTSDKRADIKATAVAAALSGEADISGGFGAMMGLHYVLFGSITETDNTTGQNLKTEKTFDQTADSALWSLGTYYKVDALRVDASYGKEFLHNGPYLISGAATKPLLGKISARYAF